MTKEPALQNVDCEPFAVEPSSGTVRASVDLVAEALKLRIPASSVLSGCRVINTARGRETAHRVFYTNDLQCETEQVAWRAAPGEQCRMELCRERNAGAPAFPAMGVGEPLMVEEGPLGWGVGHPHITFADWYGSGRQDLIVGTLAEAGYVYVSRDTGNAEAPTFDEGVRLRADGKVIRVREGGSRLGKTQPWACDWDGDGLVDLLVLVGSKADDFKSRITFYKNIGSRQEPVLTDMGPVLNEDDGPLVLSQGSRGIYDCFCPVDWTRNGKTDILAVIPVPGDEFHGHRRLVLFENVGTPDEPRFRRDPVPIVTRSGNPIAYPGLIDAILAVDWVRPGFVDVLMGSYVHYGKIFLYENAAKRPDERPVLLDSRPALGEAGIPPRSDFVTDYLAPPLELHDGTELSIPAQIAGLQVVRWGPASRRELIVATGAGHMYRLRNLVPDGGKPALDSPQLMRSRHGAIDVGAFAVPACADWNNDGKPELIVGNERGELRYFENGGTSESPLFIDRGRVRAGGESIDYPGCNKQILENGGGYSSPVAVDLDRDGLIDLVVSESRGYFNFYRNTGTPESPAFDRCRRLYLEGEVLQSPWRVMPAFFHVEGRDFTYMVSKEIDGAYFLYKNSAEDIVTFSKVRPLKMEYGENLSDTFYGRTRIALVDWRGDGVYSLVLGTHGHRLTVEGGRFELEGVSGGGQGAGLMLFENVGTNEEPVYRAPHDIKVGHNVLRRGMGHAVNPAFTDWFGDKKNDLVLGTEDGRVYLYRREILS